MRLGGIDGIMKGPTTRVGMMLMKWMLFSLAYFHAACSASVLETKYICIIDHNSQIYIIFYLFIGSNIRWFFGKSILLTHPVIFIVLQNSMSLQQLSSYTGCWCSWTFTVPAEEVNTSLLTVLASAHDFIMLNIPSIVGFITSFWKNRVNIKLNSVSSWNLGKIAQFRGRDIVYRFYNPLWNICDWLKWRNSLKLVSARMNWRETESHTFPLFFQI